MNSIITLPHVNQYRIIDYLKLAYLVTLDHAREIMLVGSCYDALTSDSLAQFRHYRLLGYNVSVTGR